MSISPLVKGGGDIPAPLVPAISYVAEKIKAKGWKLVRVFLKAQPAGGFMAAHQDSRKRGFHVSVVLRSTVSGEGGFVDFVNSRFPGVVHRIFLPKPGAWCIDRPGSGMVS